MQGWSSASSAPEFLLNEKGLYMPEQIQMPRAVFHTSTAPRTIHELVSNLQRMHDDPLGCSALYPWATRFAMGLPLAPWQRPLVWDESQMVSFIESVWYGVDLGSYLVNEREDGYFEDQAGVLRSREFTGCVLDGQQRLSALEAYVTGEIAVRDATGVPRYYVDLPIAERRRFENTIFSRATVSSSDERVLRHIYDLRAFGGVRHQESERASDGQPLNFPVRVRPT